LTKNIETLLTSLTKTAISHSVKLLSEQGMNEKTLLQASSDIVDNFRNALLKVQSELELVVNMETLLNALQRVQGIVNDKTRSKDEQEDASKLVVTASILSMMIKSKATFDKFGTTDLNETISKYITSMVSPDDNAHDVKSDKFDKIISNISNLIGGDFTSRLDEALTYLGKNTKKPPKPRSEDGFQSFLDALDIARDLIRKVDNNIKTNKATDNPVEPKAESKTKTDEVEPNVFDDTIQASVKSVMERLKNERNISPMMNNENESIINLLGEDNDLIPDDIKTALNEIQAEIPNDLEGGESIDMLKKLVKERLAGRVSVIDDTTTIEGIDVRLVRFIVHSEEYPRKSPEDNVSIDNYGGIWINSDVVVVSAPESITLHSADTNATRMLLLAYYNLQVTKQLDYEQFNAKMDNSDGYAYIIDKRTNDVYAIDIPALTYEGGKINADHVIKLEGKFKAIATVSNTTSKVN